MIITPVDPAHPDAQRILDTLSRTLTMITGDSGGSSFDPDDVRGPRAIFAMAKEGGKAVACGAIRPFSDTTAELKRMYAEPSKGKEMLRYLERSACEFGYTRLVLSTRTVNVRAVRFYESNGFRRMENFGRYAGSDKSVCLEKILSAGE